MNMMKKNGGFTLVELIVVIAILAILAGVAVPAYSGYLDKAKEASDTQVLSAVNTAIQAATAVNDATLKTATYGSDAITVTFDGDDATQATTDYGVYMTGNSTKLSYYTSVKVTDGLVEGVK